jgi:DNA-binding transcriptional LysR family regulator
MNPAHSSSMDMNLLRVFHVVYLEKSASAAAQKLGLTQSAVSHALRKLREAFGDELFVRSGQKMTPTVRAQQLHEPVQQIMETFAEKVLAVSQFDALTARREFSLAMGDLAEVVFLPPLIRHLRAHAPGCTIRTQQMSNEAMVDALERGTVELAIGHMPEAHVSFYSQTMFMHGYVVLASTSHPRVKSQLSWSEFAREQHIVVTSGSDLHLQEQALLPLGIARKVAVTIGGFLAVPWLLQGTELIATVPTRLSQDITTAAMVQQLDLPEQVKPYRLQTVWHPRSHKDPAHRWMREALFGMMKHYPDLR